MSSIALRSFLWTSLLVGIALSYGAKKRVAEARSPDMAGLFAQADQHWAFQAPQQSRLPLPALSNGFER